MLQEWKTTKAVVRVIISDMKINLEMLIDDFIPGKLISQVFIYVLLLVSIPISATLLSFVKDRVTYIFSNAISEELRRRAYDSCLHMEEMIFIFALRSCP